MKYIIYIILILAVASWFIPIIPTFNNENDMWCTNPCPSNEGFRFKTLKEVIK